jgi:hypothetical protein
MDAHVHDRVLMGDPGANHSFYFPSVPAVIPAQNPGPLVRREVPNEGGVEFWAIEGPVPVH